MKTREKGWSAMLASALQCRDENYKRVDIADDVDVHLLFKPYTAKM